MNKKIIGILICMLLVVNASAVLGISQENFNKNREGRYYIFEDLLGQKEINYIEIDDKTGNDLANNIITNTHDNLAPNPSFEEGDTKPTGWTCYSINANGIFHWDSNYSHSGEKSVGSLNLTYKQNCSVQLIWETTDFIPVDFGENEYEFSGWAKFIGTETSWNQSADFEIALYDGLYRCLGSMGAGFGFSSEWRYVSRNTSWDPFNLKPYTKYVKLQLIQLNFPPDATSIPLIEIRFDDVYFGIWNTAPNTPTITGVTNGTIRTSYVYTIQTTDPDQDKVKYYIDWGDNNNTITGLNASGAEVVVSHMWNAEGNYSIKVKAIDKYNLESDWATLTVTMPYSYNKPMPQFLELLFQRFPHAFPILRHLLGY